MNRISARSAGGTAGWTRCSRRRARRRRSSAVSGTRGAARSCPSAPLSKSRRTGMQYVRRANELYGLREDETVFCFVGRLVKSKRVQFTLKALRIVRDRGYSFKFLVGGIGNYERALRRKIKKLGLSDCVVMTGFLESEGLKTVYSARRPAALSLHSRQFRARQGWRRRRSARRGCTCAAPTPLTVRRICATRSLPKTGWRTSRTRSKWALTHPRELAEIGQHAHDELYFSWEDAAAMQAKEYLRVIREYRPKTRRRRRGKGLNAHARSMRKAAERLSEQHPAAAKNA